MKLLSIGAAAIAATGCVGDSQAPENTSSTSGALSTRWSGTYTEVNVASSQMGGVVTSSSQSLTSWTVNDGNRGAQYGIRFPNGHSFWTGTGGQSVTCPNTYDWVRIDFSGVQSIDELDLYSLQDDGPNDPPTYSPTYAEGAVPTATTVTTQHGNINFHLSYCPQGVTCGATLNSGWVDVPINGNNLAIVTLPLSPVLATGIRVEVDCSQNYGGGASVVELEAWAQSGPAPGGYCPTEPPMILPGSGSNTGPVITGSSPTQIENDADVFWGSPFGFNAMDQAAVKADTHQQFVNANKLYLAHGVPGGSASGIGVWDLMRRSIAAAELYDRLAPIDPCRASHYLEYLRVIAEESLDWRDDKQGYPQDAFRLRVMAAWGAYDAELDGKWSDDLVVAGIVAYPMAAFAKRVALNPTSFSVGYQQDAIRFTTAVMQTYASFRPEMTSSTSTTVGGPVHFSTGDPWAYHISPPGYSTLACSDPSEPTQHDCQNHRGDAGNPEGWNEDSIFLKTIAEAASAADSPLYRNSSDPYKNTAISYLAVEGPAVIAKWVQFFDDYLNTATVKDCSCSQQSPYEHLPVLEYWSGDNADYYVWDKKYNTAGGLEIENLSHAQVTLESLAAIYEDKFALDTLLSAAGYADRVNLHPYILERFNTDFLRLMWNSSNETIASTVDGQSNVGDVGAAGTVMLSCVDAWAWQRNHDAMFNSPAYTSKWVSNEDDYAALIHHYSPNVTHTGLSAHDIGVGSNGKIWITTTTVYDSYGNYTIARWDNNAWTTMPGAAVRVAVDPSGNAWVVNSAGQIYQWKLVLGGRFNIWQWVQQPGGAYDIGIGADGSVWVIGAAGNTYKWNGSGWTGMGGGGNATHIAVDPSGYAWVTKSDTSIWRFNGSSWVQVPGGYGTDISVRPDGTVAVIATDNSVIWWTGAIWVLSDASSPAVALSGGPDHLWVVNSSGQILEEM